MSSDNCVGSTHMMDTTDNYPTPADTENEGPSSGAFGDDLSTALLSVQNGTLPPDQLLRMTRNREHQTALFCLRRLAMPDLESYEKSLLLQLLQPTGTAECVIDLLLQQETSPASSLAQRLKMLDVAVETKLARRLQSDDIDTVMKTLVLLEAIGESKVILPFLFALLNSEVPKIQSKAATLIQKLDTEFIYTKRLLQHPVARVRANALESIIDRNDMRASEYLRSCTTDPDTRVRSLAGLGLCRQNDPLGLKVLIEMVCHPDPAMRCSGVWALGFSAQPQVLRFVEALGDKDPDERVRRHARMAQERLSTVIQQTPNRSDNMPRR